MAFQFLKFTDVDASFVARVTVRQRTGQLGFNRGAINRFRVHDFNYAVLYFDAQARVVGIELVNDPVEGAVDIKKSQANTYVRAKNFLDCWDIDYATSHSHELKKDAASGLLYFQLDKVVEAGDEPPADDEDAAM